MINISGDKGRLWQEYSLPPVQSIISGKGQPALSILRLDLIKSWASGNKYFKLKYSLHHALQQDINVVVSKGGMFSNHLAALSEACLVFGKHLVAVVRSHAEDEHNPSILRLKANGTELLYLAPKAYNAFDQSEAESKFPGALFIPEGGLSQEGIKGTSEISQACIQHMPTHIVLPGGTMGTACGLLATMPESVNVIIVPAWKGCTEEYISGVLHRFEINPSCSWQLWPDDHFGGFGKFDKRLIDYMTAFSNITGIPLDPVYTGKMMFGLYRKIEQGYFTASDAVLAIHTGGLQGLEGFRYRYPGQWGSYLREVH
jgi:1-aminocyclopropane-1-carboxylate deaminase